MPWQVRGGVERRSKVIMGLLVLMVVLTGVLAYQAQDAARSYRVTAERALRNYASIAAWGLSHQAQEVLFTLLLARIDSINPGRQLAGSPAAKLPGARALEDCRCFEGNHNGIPFALTDDGRTLLSDAPLPPVAEAWIVDSVYERSAVQAFRRWQVGIAFPRGSADAVAYARRPGPDKAPEIVVGLVSPAQEFAALFASLVHVFPALPESLLRGDENDALMSVEVLTPDGVALYRSRRIYSPAFSASDTLPPPFGDLRMRVALRPEAADQLVIGGLPHTRLPLLLSLLALALALCTIAVLQLRRETELVRMREDFVSSVSHELRTPLAQIRMFSETLLLGRTRSEAERRRSLEIIEQEARRLSHLVENVLRISRSAHGTSRIAPEQVVLTEEVAAGVESFRPFATQRRVELRSELQPDVLGVVDRGALRQMLLNLLDNALKYAPAGREVVVRLALADDRARIQVDDQGPGIPAEDREKVFAPFYRSRSVGAPEVPGSGIGLAVVRDIALLHGGRAWAEAAPGGGARICVELPHAHAGSPATDGPWVAA